MGRSAGSIRGLGIFVEFPLVAEAVAVVEAEADRERSVDLTMR